MSVMYFFRSMGCNAAPKNSNLDFQAAGLDHSYTTYTISSRVKEKQSFAILN